MRELEGIRREGCVVGQVRVDNLSVEDGLSKGNGAILPYDAIAVIVFVAVVDIQGLLMLLSPGLRRIANIIAVEMPASRCRQFLLILAHDGEYGSRHKTSHNLRSCNIHQHRRSLDLIHCVQIMQMLDLVTQLIDGKAFESSLVPHHLQLHMTFASFSDLFLPGRGSFGTRFVDGLRCISRSLQATSIVVGDIGAALVLATSVLSDPDIVHIWPVQIELVRLQDDLFSNFEETLPYLGNVPGWIEEILDTALRRRSRIRRFGR